MQKIRFTKGELKKRRDELHQYRRYLPILQLKKQQLQMEILRQAAMLEKKRVSERERYSAALSWAGFLSDENVELGALVRVGGVEFESRNIAGVEAPFLKHVGFEKADYDLFLTPLWVDRAIEDVEGIVLLRKEIAVIENSIELLRGELRTTTQRVNLFEKVKIPDAEEAIRRIKIYMGDQMANAVGRSKIAKKKIELTVSGAKEEL